MAIVTPKVRLSLIWFLIVGSAIYAILVVKNPDFARTIMVGYIGVILTVFIANELFKRP